MRKDNTQYGKPYTAREYRSVGIAMIITGLLATLVCISAYRFGSEAQMVSTKWGTEILPESGPGNTIYLILGAGGIVTSIGGILLLMKSRRNLPTP